LTDGSRTAFVFAEFVGSLSFDDVSRRSPNGLLSQMSEKRYNAFVATSGLEPSQVPTREQMFCLWTEGSRQNLESLFALLVFLTVLGLSIYPLCLWGHREWLKSCTYDRNEWSEGTMEAVGRDSGQAPRTYRLNRPWLIVTVFGSVLSLVCAGLFIAGMTLQGATLGGDVLSAWDYSIATFFLLLFLVLGVGGIATAVSSKIVVSSTGITYHTLGGTLSADWSGFKVKFEENSVESKPSVTLFPLNPRVSLRKWASFLPWNANRGLVENGIPVSRQHQVRWVCQNRVSRLRRRDIG
jgi:hypothetical protein